MDIFFLGLCRNLSLLERIFFLFPSNGFAIKLWVQNPLGACVTWIKKNASRFQKQYLCQFRRNNSFGLKLWFEEGFFVHTDGQMKIMGFLLIWAFWLNSTRCQPFVGSMLPELPITSQYLFGLWNSGNF